MKKSKKEIEEKKKIELTCKILKIASIILLVVYGVFIVIDYRQYDSLTFSAPFSAYILVRSLEFLLPSIILHGVAIIIEKKEKKKGSR